MQPQEALFEAHNLLRNCCAASRPACSPSPPSRTANRPRSRCQLRRSRSQAATLQWLAAAQAAATRGAHEQPSVPAWHATRDGARDTAPHRRVRAADLQNDDVLRDRLGEERVRKIQLLHAGFEPASSMCRTARRSMPMKS